MLSKILQNVAIFSISLLFCISAYVNLSVVIGKDNDVFLASVSRVMVSIIDIVLAVWLLSKAMCKKEMDASAFITLMIAHVFLWPREINTLVKTRE